MLQRRCSWCCSNVNFWRQVFLSYGVTATGKKKLLFMNDKLTDKISLPHVEGSSQNIMLKSIFLLTEGLQQERFSSTKQLSQKISALLCNTKKKLSCSTLLCVTKGLSIYFLCFLLLFLFLFIVRERVFTALTCWWSLCCSWLTDLIFCCISWVGCAETQDW